LRDRRLAGHSHDRIEIVAGRAIGQIALILRLIREMYRKEGITFGV
jgi:hypothetical protein